MKTETMYDQLYFTTAYIEKTTKTGDVHAGTGFIYNVNVGDGKVANFLVTNRHVVDESTQVRIRFIASKDEALTEPELGKTCLVNADSSSFTFHPDPDPDIDIAVAPITPWIRGLSAMGNWVFFRSISPSIAVTAANESELDSLEPVTFDGYPNGLFDTVTYLPIVRRGFTASPPGVDYGGKPIFLVDASVFPGSSGSPLLIAETGSYTARGGGLIVGSRIRWLGVVAAVYQRVVPVLTVSTGSNSFVQDTINIGIVYKARCVDEVVDQILSGVGIARVIEQASEPVVAPDPAAPAPPV